MTEINPAYMKLALRLAAKGAGWVSPNPMVGAVVVKGGRVWGRAGIAGWARPTPKSRPCGRPAPRAGDRPLRHLEPCNHQGPTPPCTPAILAAGVAQVVIATPDPDPQVAGGGTRFLNPGG